VLVSTYAKHGLKLTALLTSLLSSGYPNIDLILLDTDTKSNSTEWLLAVAELVNKHMDLHAPRKRVHVSRRTQLNVEKHFPDIVGSDFG
jgi:hypothetical protein